MTKNVASGVRLCGVVTLLCSVSALFMNRADASDWPQFKRDAARIGNAPDEKLTFPMQRIVAVRLPAPIYASPAVVGGRVYIQDAAGNVACVEVKTNRVVWITKLGGHNNSSSPAVANRRVFVGNTGGFLAVLDADNGKELNRLAIDGKVIAAPAVTDAGVYFLSDSGVLAKCDLAGQPVWTLKLGSSSHLEFAVIGKVVWCFANHDGCKLASVVDQGDKGEPKYSSGGRPTGGVLPWSDGAAWHNYDSESGWVQVIGKTPATIGGDGWDDSRATCSLRGDHIYTGNSCLNRITGAVVWQAADERLQSSTYHSSPALSAEHQVIGTESGHVVCVPLEDRHENDKRQLDKKAGVARPTAWSFETAGAKHDVNHAVSSSPAIADGALFVGGEDGILYGLGHGAVAPVRALLAEDKCVPGPLPGSVLNGREWHTNKGDMGYSGVSDDPAVKPPFALKWKTRVWSSFKAPPVVAQGKVYGCTRMGQIIALDAEDGRIVWRTQLAWGESRAGATYIEGKLLIQRGRDSYRGKPNTNVGLHCLDAETGKRLWRRNIPFGYAYNNDGLVAANGLAFAAWNSDGGRLEIAAYALTTGKEVWHHSLVGFLPPDRTAPARTIGAWGEGLWFLAVAKHHSMGLGRFVGKSGDKNVPGAVLAIDPKDGAVRWQTREHFVGDRQGIAYRNGTLVVFTDQGGHALEPQTGKLLWLEQSLAAIRARNTGEVYFGHFTYGIHPLSDAYLSSHGRLGVTSRRGCENPVQINGLWYKHKGMGANSIECVEQSDSGADKEPVRQTRWTYSFASNACSSPVAAYGHLYYVPNGEGVIYCFAPVSATQ